MKRVEGKVAIVTGGASGIGAATCRVLALEGAQVVVADISERRGPSVAESIRADGGDVHFMRLDAGDAASWRAVVDDTVARFGGLDILVNCAYSGKAGAVDTMPDETWGQAFRVTTDGVFYGMKTAGAQMRAGGAIVNIASVAAYRGSTHNVAYAAAKSAVISATRSAAMRFAEMPHKIRVNAVAPGMIQTPALEKTFEALARQGRSVDSTKAAMVRQIPLGHVGAPEDIARAVLFLASDEARYITGTELVVDGGFLARW
ncbi:SDR family NAD(P)-dependent oxidoreductase [Vineibacter terrae]|uniref:SDR family NAD(P)-dependent oxidoreductase n=1 Tax=Vineibacter terrae TaxID=2586908 RepID=UPI002E374571|nr:SDR family NAD(P)-dependent oxidoreductase [Vineibacter terrae]HEX2886561.1 SDR family NAD(P)-dependent oxidoreductase [Vineibacter terrae]